MIKQYATTGELKPISNHLDSKGSTDYSFCYLDVKNCSLPSVSFRHCTVSL